MKLNLEKPIYLVVWEDSETADGWDGAYEIDEHLNFHPMSSVGFLIAENDKGIALAISWDPKNERANPILYIPHAAIINMHIIYFD